VNEEYCIYARVWWLGAYKDDKFCHLIEMLLNVTWMTLVRTT